MSDYELVQVRYNRHSGQAIVTIPVKSPLYGKKYVKIVEVKE